MPELFPDLYSREMGMSGFTDQMSKDARHLLVVASADATKSARVPDVKRFDSNRCRFPARSRGVITRRAPRPGPLLFPD